MTIVCVSVRYKSFRNFQNNFKIKQIIDTVYRVSANDDKIRELNIILHDINSYSHRKYAALLCFKIHMI